MSPRVRHDTAYLVEDMQARRKAHMLMGGGALALMLVALLTFMFWPSDEEPEPEPPPKAAVVAPSPTADAATEKPAPADAPPATEAADKPDAPPVTVVLAVKRGMKVKVDGKKVKARRRKITLKLPPGEYTIETKAGRRGKWVKQTLEVPAGKKRRKGSFNKRKKTWSLK